MANEMAGMRTSIDELNAKVIEQNRTIQGQLREIKRLTKKNADKDALIAELEEKLCKYEDNNSGDKNSTNSSTPPSKEDMKSEVIRRTQSQRKPTGKKPGGQPGHDGTTLGWFDEPDEIIDDQSQYCTQCGADLSNVKAILEYSNQEIDIELPKPKVTKYRHWVKKCSCGCCNRPYPKKKRFGSQ